MKILMMLLAPFAAAWRPLVPLHGARRSTVLHASTTPTILLRKSNSLDLLDEEAMLQSQNDSPFTPDELVSKAQAFIECKYGANDASMLAPTFQFIGPFVGPLDRKQYIDALSGALDPSDGFPDLCGRQYGFVADPVEVGRVWWFTRPTGTFTQPFFGAEPTGEKLETAPQCMGVVLDAAGAVTKFNMGTPVDRTAGNSGGMGGLFAFLHFVGKPLPIPECRPYQKSLPFQLLTTIGGVLGRLSAATPENS